MTTIPIMGITFHRSGINLIKFIFENASASSIVVLPTKRAIREFIGLYRGVYEAPNLFTHEEFFNSLLDSKYIAADKFIKNLFLREAVLNVKDSRKIMKNDFEYIKDITMLESFIDDLGAFYREIASGKVDFDRLKRFSAYTDYYEHIEILEEIFVEYKKALHKNGFEDIDLLKTIKIEEMKKDLNGSSEIYLATSGFFTNFEVDAIKRLSETCKFHIVVEDAKIPKKMESILKRLGGFKGSEEDRLHQNIKIKRFSTKSAMAGWVIQTVRYEYYHNHIPLNRIKVVLPDESLAELLRTFDRELFNFANGFRLDESLYYTYIKALIELNENMHSGLYRTAYLIKLLNHPFSNSYARKILNRIYKDALPVCELFPDELKAISIDRFNSIYNCNSITLQDASAGLIELLKDVSKRYEKQNPHIDYIKATQTIFDELERLAMLNRRLIRLKSTGAIILKYILKRVGSIRFPDAGIGKVTVMGMLEARLLSQDVVIIPSLNDGILPKVAKKELFLNSIIRSECNLPVRIDREELQQYYFRSIIRASKTAHLAYLTDDELQMSKFLADIIRIYHLKVETGVMITGYITGRTIEAKKHGSVIEKIEKDEYIIGKLKKKRFSAQAIDSYMKCPYQFYLRYVKGIKSRIDFDYYPFEIGRIVHRALAHLYDETVTGPLHLKERFKKLFTQEKSRSRIIASDPSYKIRADYFLYRIEHSEFFHQNLLGKAEKIVTEFEFDSMLDCGQVGEVEFVGRIDRIDFYKDCFEIIDYKTGTFDLFSGVNKNYSVQLPLYGYAIQKHFVNSCKGLFYYDLGSFRKIDFIGKYDLDAKELIEYTIDKIRRLVSEIFDIDTPFIKSERHCVFCDYKTICRGLSNAN